MTIGVDVSHWNNSSHILYLIKKGDIDFLIAKYGQGKSMCDDNYEFYADECQIHGVPFGAYYYMDNTATIEEIAERLYKMYRDKRASMLPIIDYEDESVLNSKGVNMLDDVIKLFTSKYNTAPILYASYAVLQRPHIQSIIGYYSVPIWVARYKYKGFAPHISLDSDTDIRLKHLQLDVNDRKAQLNQISSQAIIKNSLVQLDVDICRDLSILFSKPLSVLE